MRVLSLLLVFGLVESSATALAAEAFPRAGDPEHGQQVYALSCRGCHGDKGDGAGVMAAHLGHAPGAARSLEVGFRHSDDDLFKLLREGGPSLGLSPIMPRTGLTVLEAWDVVAYLREGLPRMTDFFPGAARVLEKRYTLDDTAAGRLAKELGKAPAQASAPVEVVTLFNGSREPGNDPVIEAQDPVTLDSLKPREKVGYVVFVSAQVAGDSAPRPVALGIDLQGKIVHAASSYPDAPAAREKALAAYVGLGQRGPFAPLSASGGAKDKKAKKGKAPASAGGASSMDAAYAVASEAINAYEKEERDRTWADAPAK